MTNTLTPITSEEWGSILSRIAQNSIDQKYLSDTLDPLINKTDCAYHIDDLGESLIFYAITYQNTLLLAYLKDKINYPSLHAKVKTKLKESIFRAIKQLCYNCDKNEEFL